MPTEFASLLIQGGVLGTGGLGPQAVFAAVPFFRSKPVRLEVQTPAPRDHWRRLLNLDPEAMPDQSPEITDWICEAGRFRDASRYYRTDDGAEFIMPMVRSRKLPMHFGMASSLPLAWGTGGIIGTRPVDPAVVSQIFEDLAGLPYLQIVISPNPRVGSVWKDAVPPNVVTTQRLAHAINVSEGYDHVWAKKFSKTTRSRVRKAMRYGLRVEADNTGRLMPVFCDLLKLSLDRWAKNQNEPRMLTHLRGYFRDPPSKFEALARHMGEACTVWVAWDGCRPAAASIVLYGRNANDIRCVMDKEIASTSGANDLLLHHSIAHACQRGAGLYHLGETGPSASLAHFKKRFGAEPYPYADYAVEKLPLTRFDRSVRSIVKRMIGFKD